MATMGDRNGFFSFAHIIWIFIFFQNATLKKNYFCFFIEFLISNTLENPDYLEAYIYFLSSFAFRCRIVNRCQSIVFTYWPSVHFYSLKEHEGSTYLSAVL